MDSILNQEVLYRASVPFFVVLILAELLYSNLKGIRLYTLRDSLTSAFFALCNISLDMLMKVFSFAVLTWCYQYKIMVIAPVWLYWLALLLLQDLAYWAQHTVDHRVRLGWAVHITHHNSEHYNLTTGFRSSVFQPLYRYVYFMPLAFLGFEPLHIMFMYAATQIYGNLVHTQTINQLGFLEKFMVTPSHHRVHHASNTPYLDKNMGMLFIWWDKMFGTFEREGRDPEPIRFGLVSPIVSRNPVRMMLSEFAAILRDVTQPNLTIGQRWMYVFGPPGWSHDGSKQTSAQMQAIWNTQHPM